MATFSITMEFIVKADDQEEAQSLSKQIIDACLMEDIIRKADQAKVQDIEMLDDDETEELDFNEDDE